MIIHRKCRKVVKADDGWVIDVEFTPIWIARLFGARSFARRYRGRCTVWHLYPTGERAGTLMEGWLCEQWQAAKWTEAKD